MSEQAHDPLRDPAPGSPRRVLVALDGSDHARIALELAACLPLTARDELVLLSVAQVDEATIHRLRRRQGRDLDVLLSDAWTAQRSAARGEVEAAGARLSAWQAPVRQLVRSGTPAEVIAAATRELHADLLVVGPLGRGGLPSLLLGSVALALLGRVPCPVLVARPPIGAPRRVILAVDGSLHAGEAIRALAAFPLATGAGVTVVTATGPGSTTHSPGEATAIADAAAARLREAGLAAATAVPAGEARRAIVEEARTRGRRPRRRGLPGPGGRPGALHGLGLAARGRAGSLLRARRAACRGASGTRRERPADPSPVAYARRTERSTVTVMRR